MGFQRIARWCWRSCSSTRTLQCDIVVAERGTHCQNGSTHARRASISIVHKYYLATNHADSHIWSPSIVYTQVRICTWFSINCWNSLNAWHVTILWPVEKPETSGSPLNVWNWHSVQRVKQCVTQTCRGSAAEHRGTRWEQCALRSSSAKM